MRNVYQLSFVMFILCVFGNITCHAVEAYPYWVDFRQPDGAIVKVKMRGNEFIKWAETEDGHTLLYDSKGFLVYAQKDDDGDIVPSGIRAVSWERSHVEMPEQVKSLPKGLSFSKRQINTVEQIRRARSADMAPARANAPVIGTRKMLMLLVEYQDVKFCHGKEDFDMLMNQINYTENGNTGSVKDFFLENSFGKFELETEVAGIYTLPHERAYYGGNEGGSTDSKGRQMAVDAVELADADVDFSKFDNDGDGIVDGIHIIYAGPGEEAGGGADCIWAHSSGMFSRKDNVVINRYSCSPEIRGAGGISMTFIGVICHEIGHVLGCKDFYDTNYSYGGQYQGTGKWDLMGSGSWNANGACPAHFNPYIKIYNYGWATAIDGNAGISVTLTAKSQDGFVRIDTGNAGEYFLLEYRSNTGFDKALPGHGLMVYHAYNDLASAGSNTINAFHQQQFYPVCANAPRDLPNSEPSSYGTVNSASAPFPGTLRKKELTDFSVPSLKMWANVESGCTLTEIYEDIDNESVSFDINGGSEGRGAYNLKVADSDLSSISLEWSNPDGYEVMLVCNDAAEMGAVESRDYSVGETLTGGGEVIFKGNATAFKHTGLENNITMYYKLFTHKDDGSWIAGKVTCGKTEAGVVRRFPYKEDFETGTLDSSWGQEHIFNTIDWNVEDFQQTGNFKLVFNINGFGRQATRVVSPVMDLSGKKNALLSFDCINTIKPVRVLYRTSRENEWNELGVVPSDYDFDIILDSGMGYVKSQEKRHYFQLPEISSEYQVAFDGEVITRTSWSSSELASLDNFSIEADYEVKVVTKPCSFIGSDHAEVPYGVFQGDATVVEHGVEWSIDKVSWKSQSAADADRVNLDGLPVGRMVYYRYYAILDGGAKYMGDISSFTTLSFDKGKGTCEEPFQITNDKELNSLIEFVNAGNTCKGLYFRLTTSVGYKFPYTTKPKGIFEGCIDGDGNTIQVSEGIFYAFFFMVAKAGKVKNLNVKFSELKTCINWCAGICSMNKGDITNCHVYCDKLNIQNFRNFGGVCAKNYGVISGCSSYINLEIENTNNGAACVGGIVWHNYGIINDCSFDGLIQCHNNSESGGIAVCNYKDDDFSRMRSGLISNCVNNGTIEVIYSNTLGTPYYNTIGGIAGTNYGLVDQCKNNGELKNYTSNASGWSCSMGGIVGRISYGIVQNSYNNGNLTAPEPYTDQRAGGIAGDNDRGGIINCVDMQPFSLTASKPDYINGVVGWTRQIEIANCFYTGDVADQYATKCSSDTLAHLAKIFNNEQSAEVWNGEGNLCLAWELSGVKMAMGRITDFTANYMAFDACISGEGVDGCGVEWRKKGDEDWNNMILDSSEEILHIRIENLQPATCYEARLYATGENGVTYYSATERFATMFDSYGDSNDPHLIRDYDELLAFNEMIAHGEEFNLATIKLMNDIDLKGNLGVLWTPMKNKYDHSATFRGDFDGNGKLIRNMKVCTGKYFAGFFGSSCGYIHDLQIWDAEVESHSTPAWQFPIGGTAVICGENAWTNSLPYSIERCGVSGKIRGNGLVGGIMGRTTNENIRDCYAIVDLAYQQGGVYSLLGIAYNSNVSDCYTVVNYCTNSGISPFSSKSVSNCYYNSIYLFTDDFGTRLDISQMKTDDFLGKLKASLWTRADHVNGGLPVLSGLSHSRISTIGAECDSDDNIVLHGLYVAGTDKDFKTLGFQWYGLSDDILNVKESVADVTSPSYSLVMSDGSSYSAGLVYRSFATQDLDTLYGEWKMFVPVFSSTTQKLILQEGWNWISHIMAEPVDIGWLSPIERIMNQTQENFNDPLLGMVGSIDMLNAGVAYKVKASAGIEHVITGMPFNPKKSFIGVENGWNWIAYPLALIGSPQEAIANPSEGDCISGQMGYAEYVDGQWQGSLTKLMPGMGYLYKASEPKSLRFNSLSSSSADVSMDAEGADGMEGDLQPDIYKYPHTMNITAIVKNGNLLSEDDYLICAMVGNECRGVGRKIAGRYFVTVYGEDAVPVNFRLKDIRTGTEYEVSESLVFRGDLVGSVKCPFEFNVSPTSISRIFDGSSKSKEVYSIEGLKVKDVITADELGKLPNGIYIIDGQKIVIE